MATTKNMFTAELEIDSDDDFVLDIPSGVYPINNGKFKRKFKNDTFEKLKEDVVMFLTKCTVQESDFRMKRYDAFDILGGIGSPHVVYARTCIYTMIWNVMNGEKASINYGGHHEFHLNFYSPTGMQGGLL